MGPESFQPRTIGGQDYIIIATEEKLKDGHSLYAKPHYPWGFLAGLGSRNEFRMK